MYIFKTIIIFTLLNITSLTYGQNDSFGIKVIYKMTYQPDSTDTKRLSEYMELVSNSKESIFRSTKQAFVDSAKAKQADYDIRANVTPFTYSIVKSYKENTIAYYNVIAKLAGEIKKYTEKSSAFSWDVQDEIKDINGYNCQKALVNFGNRFWEAWFTVDIPISDGPYKFNGLPGLIVAIHDSKNCWDFELVSIQKTGSSDLDLSFLTPFTELEKKSYYKELSYYNVNQVQINEAAGLLGFPDPKMRDIMIKRVQEMNKKNNNWIELIP